MESNQSSTNNVTFKENITVFNSNDIIISNFSTNLPDLNNTNSKPNLKSQNVKLNAKKPKSKKSLDIKNVEENPEKNILQVEPSQNQDIIKNEVIKESSDSLDKTESEIKNEKRSDCKYPKKTLSRMDKKKFVMMVEVNRFFLILNSYHILKFFF